MDLQLISDLISNQGFSIVMCCALFWYMVEQRKDHKSEVEKLTASLENNTVALTQLTDYIKKKNGMDQ